MLRLSHFHDHEMADFRSFPGFCLNPSSGEDEQKLRLKDLPRSDRIHVWSSYLHFSIKKSSTHVPIISMVLVYLATFSINKSTKCG